MNKTEKIKNIKPDIECQYFNNYTKTCTHPNYSRIANSECRAFTRKAR